MSTSTLMTAEQLFELSPRLPRAELIEGDLREMTPSGAERGLVSLELMAELRDFLKRNPVGRAFAEVGFVIRRDPDTVLVPDGAFISSERLALTGVPSSFYNGAPDLVLEVISPTDRPKQYEEKARIWLAAGARLVWLIHPRKCTATIYRPGVDPVTISADDDLTGEDVVTGFQCRLGSLLP